MAELMSATSDRPKSLTLRATGTRDADVEAAANCFAPGRAASAAREAPGTAPTTKTKTATAPSAPAAIAFTFVAIARLNIASFPHESAHSASHLGEKAGVRVHCNSPRILTPHSVKKRSPAAKISGRIVERPFDAHGCRLVSSTFKGARWG